MWHWWSDCTLIKELLQCLFPHHRFDFYWSGNEPGYLREKQLLMPSVYMLLYEYLYYHHHHHYNGVPDCPRNAVCSVSWTSIYFETLQTKYHRVYRRRSRLAEGAISYRESPILVASLPSSADVALTEISAVSWEHHGRYRSAHRLDGAALQVGWMDYWSERQSSSVYFYFVFYFHSPHVSLQAPYVMSPISLCAYNLESEMQ